ncbi:MAG: SDR family NAD(P)-dependent oxidoreductase [Acidimicrobiales bacterium]
MTDAFGHPDSVLVLGGTSDIARAVVRRVVADRCRKVALAGRDPAALAAAAKEASDAGADTIDTIPFDAIDVDRAAAVVDSGFAALGRVDLVVVAVGVLYDDEADERDPDRVADCITVNFTWPAAALSRVAVRFRDQRAGQAVVLSSVAGVRVRRANYIYGSAKAGLDAYARAVNQTLAGSGAGVTVVRPGFVQTKMTEGRAVRPLSTTPDAVATDIVKGLERRAEVVWSPAVMRALFGVFGLLPEPVWRRLPM